MDPQLETLRDELAAIKAKVAPWDDKVKTLKSQVTEKKRNTRIHGEKQNDRNSVGGHGVQII